MSPGFVHSLFQVLLLASSPEMDRTVTHLLLDVIVDVDERVTRLLVVFDSRAAEAFTHDILFSLLTDLEVIKAPPFISYSIEYKGVIMSTFGVSIVD